MTLIYAYVLALSIDLLSLLAMDVVYVFTGPSLIIFGLSCVVFFLAF